VAGVKTARARTRERWWTGNPSGLQVANGRVDVPDDVERREESAPCFACGARGGCRHRPWLVQA
jgi:hypothetical protein